MAEYEKTAAGLWARMVAMEGDLEEMKNRLQVLCGESVIRRLDPSQDPKEMTYVSMLSKPTVSTYTSMLSGHENQNRDCKVRVHNAISLSRDDLEINDESPGRSSMGSGKAKSAENISDGPDKFPRTSEIQARRQKSKAYEADDERSTSRRLFRRKKK